MNIRFDQPTRGKLFQLDGSHGNIAVIAVADDQVWFVDENGFCTYAERSSVEFTEIAINLLAKVKENDPS